MLLRQIIAALVVRQVCPLPPCIGIELPIANFGPWAKLVLAAAMVVWKASAAMRLLPIAQFSRV